MTRLALISLFALIAGCSTTTPNYDARFGDALREAKLNMTINPDAGSIPDQASGLDGKAAREAITLYQGTYKAPPPAVNVINIGGAIGNK